MKINGHSPIRSMKDLNAAKEKLQLQIAAQETELLEHPLVSIPLALMDGTSVKGSLHDSLESFSLGNYKNALYGLVSTVMLANRKTRKIFVVFLIAKEVVPFLIRRVDDMMRK